MVFHPRMAVHQVGRWTASVCPARWRTWNGRSTGGACGGGVRSHPPLQEAQVRRNQLRLRSQATEDPLRSQIKLEGPGTSHPLFPTWLDKSTGSRECFLLKRFWLSDYSKEFGLKSAILVCCPIQLPLSFIIHLSSSPSLLARGLRSTVPSCSVSGTTAPGASNAGPVTARSAAKRTGVRTAPK